MVKDSITQQPISFASIGFSQLAIGTQTNSDGKFSLSNSKGDTNISVSYLGYGKKNITVPLGTTSDIEILLTPKNITLDVVVINQTKEKYSKRGNPAIELIEKVITNKNRNNIKNLSLVKNEEYERILVALNDFEPQQTPFKQFEFLPNYIDTSAIGQKPILPLSVRETVKDGYYKKEPESQKKLVKGYNFAGIDKAIQIDGIETYVAEMFKDISIYDNNISFLLTNFIGPLNEHLSTTFYKWYIIDTIKIEGKKYINLGFVPFNTRDIGLSGFLYISTDDRYAVKKASIRIPKKANINFVEELIIEHEFDEMESNIWVPSNQRMSMDMSMYNTIKIHVDKVNMYSNYSFTAYDDSIFSLPPPTIYQNGFTERTKDFWLKNRPPAYHNNFRMNELMADLHKSSFAFKLLMAPGDFITSGYIMTSKDTETNKVDIGTLRTLYSYNKVEGNRFRLTFATTQNLHPRLFLYGYGAYGTRDGKFKYYGETTWSFREVGYSKDEFPKDNLTFAYKYDINSLGQTFTQMERDNILMSLRSSEKQKLTYNKLFQFFYEREYHNGFSYKIATQASEKRPAGKLMFEKMDMNNSKYSIKNIHTTELATTLRYADERFYQKRRRRQSVPYPAFIANFSHTVGIKDFLDGEYNYNKTSLSVSKELWMGPYGKLLLSAQTDKLWGKAPFPSLIAPNANSSFAIQNGSFALLEPLEFIHDSQISWETTYRMGGLIFNRIPFLNQLRIREVIGLKGVWGHLSDKNNPLHNKDMISFPNDSFTTGNVPYMEYNIGIENILSLFRIDYVHRANYHNHPDINKSGVRLSAEFNF